MLQAAAAFGGGIYLKQALDAVQLPRLTQAGSDTAAFTLSVRVLAASVPGLAAPGIVSHDRPFLEGTLGVSKKATEFADFAASGSGPYAKECPWRFGDTLTFKVRTEDVTGPGLKLSLKVRKDIVLGPVQFEMRSNNVGDGALQFTSKILPACVQEKHDTTRGCGLWASPVLLVPLAHVPDGLLGAGAKLGEAVAHVAVVFSLDADPEPILAASRPLSLAQKWDEHVDGVKRWLGQKVDEVDKRQQASVDGVMRWLDKPSTLDRVAGVSTPQRLNSRHNPLSTPERNSKVQPTSAQRERAPPQLQLPSQKETQAGNSPIPVSTPTSRKGQKVLLPPLPPQPPMSPSQSSTRSRGSTPRNGFSPRADQILFPSGDRALCAPEDSSDGWVSHRHPNGRLFWHHRSQGPAPWEVRGSPFSRSSSFSGPQLATCSSFGRTDVGQERDAALNFERSSPSARSPGRPPVPVPVPVSVVRPTPTLQQRPLACSGTRTPQPSTPQRPLHHGSRTPQPRQPPMICGDEPVDSGPLHTGPLDSGPLNGPFCGFGRALGMHRTPIQRMERSSAMPFPDEGRDCRVSGVKALADCT